MSHFNIAVAIPAERLHGLAINRNTMEEILEAIMAPYWESTEDPRFLTFEDRTETCQTEYLTDTCDFVKLPDGTVCTTGDTRFYTKYEIYENTVCSHRERHMETPVETEDSKQVLLMQAQSVSECFSFEDYCDKYCGYKKNEAGHWGYYHNSNAEWDWFEIGGRWSGALLAKSWTPDAIYAYRALASDDPTITAFSAVDGARKKDIAWDDMRRIRRQMAEEQYHRYVNAFKTKNTKDLDCISAIRDDGIYGWGDLLYKANESLEDYLNRSGLRDDIGVGFYPYAYVDKAGKWHSQGDMGWFGLTSGDKPQDVWHDEINAFIDALAPDDFIISVDCHI